MKKLFILLVLSSFGFIACNSNSETKATEDSTTVSVDTVAIAPADSVISFDSVPVTPPVDTVHH